MKKTSKKNISKLLQDIRHHKKGANLKFLLKENRPIISKILPKAPKATLLNTLSKQSKAALQNALSFVKEKQAGLLTIHKYSWAIKVVVILFILGINFYIFNLLNFKNLVLSKTVVIYEELSRGKTALSELRPKAAESAFLAADQELTNIRQKARNYGFTALSGLLGNLIPGLKGIPQVLNNLSYLNQTSLAIAKNVDYLTNHGLALALNNGGSQIITALENLHYNIGQLMALNIEIKKQSDQLKTLSSKITSFVNTFNDDYISTSVNLAKAREWLGAFLTTLKSTREQHLLIIFQNPSEMRPAGGFIGSHADITIWRGSIKNIAIDDIYNADRQLDLKIIPPKQLQSLTKDWGARDANWFFDFPTSAQKVVYLLENSNLYKQKSIRFLGLTAINIKVLESLLEITGPIKVPQYELVLDQENFLQEVQYEVEAGRDKKPGQNPKKILSVVAPLILEKLTNLSESQKTVLLTKFQQHLKNKDILFYFKDQTLQSFAVEMNVAGEILALPKNFSGDYLAVVNANIAGGKTDAFINQEIILKSEISGDGTIYNYLTIKKRHSGQNEEEWWYTTDNKSFVKILTPQNSRLKAITGNYYKTVNRLINYERAGYQQDPHLQSIENSNFLKKFQAEVGQEFGKTYFATWFRVPAGTQKTLELQYDNPRRAIVKDGASYKFIFEKQSGTQGSLEYSVTAPLGYVWQETGTDIFEYTTLNPQAREIIELTLMKL